MTKKKESEILPFSTTMVVMEMVVYWVGILILLRYYYLWYFQGLAVNWIVVLIGLQLLWKGQYLFYSLTDSWTGEKLNFLEATCQVSIHRFLNFWHNFEAHDLARIRDMKGSRLLVGYHSRNTMDLVYLVNSLKPKILVSYLFFKVPVFNHLLPLVGLMPSKTDGDQVNEGSFVDALVNSPKPVMLLPGGVIECLKPYDDQYLIQWKTRPGFARIIHENHHLFQEKGGISVIPFYTKNAERVTWNPSGWYDRTGKLSLELYQRFKKGEMIIMCYMLSTMIASLGCVIFPLPYKLDTYFGQAIRLHPGESVESFSARIQQHLQAMIEIINNEEDPEIIQKEIAALDTSKVIEQPPKRNAVAQRQYVETINQFHWRELVGHHWRRWVPGYFCFLWSLAIYAFLQNTFLYIYFTAVIWTLFPPTLLLHLFNVIIALFRSKRKESPDLKVD